MDQMAIGYLMAVYGLTHLVGSQEVVNLLKVQVTVVG